MFSFNNKSIVIKLKQGYTQELGEETNLKL